MPFILFHLDHAIDILSRTPGVLRTLLLGLPEPWIRHNYGESTFSPFDVVGHLIHGERTDWLPRARLILDHGQSRPFEPFDRYAMYEESRGKTLADLLDTFAALRRENLAALAALNLSEAQLDGSGTHPALGRVTLRELLATWVAHDLNHLAQICKAMTYQYRDAVGPWRAYISLISQ